MLRVEQRELPWTALLASNNHQVKDFLGQAASGLSVLTGIAGASPQLG